jgi:hypothetical protein
MICVLISDGFMLLSQYRLDCIPELVEERPRPQLTCDLPALTGTPAHFVVIED